MQENGKESKDCSNCGNNSQFTRMVCFHCWVKGDKDAWKPREGSEGWRECCATCDNKLGGDEDEGKECTNGDKYLSPCVRCAYSDKSLTEIPCKECRKGSNFKLEKKAEEKPHEPTARKKILVVFKRCNGDGSHVYETVECDDWNISTDMEGVGTLRAVMGDDLVFRADVSDILYVKEVGRC